MELQANPAPAASYRLFYRQAGGGGPAVVLMHGNPTHSYLWEPIMPALARQYRVIAPDLLGYGQSQLAPPEDLTLPRQAEHILALLDELGIQQAHFIGHDLGGGIAQILALSYPDRVLSIALIDTVCYSNWPVPLATGMRWPIAPEFEPTAVIQEMLRIGVHNQSMLTPEIFAAMVEPYRTVKEPRALQVAAFALEHHQTEDVSPRMGSVTVPTTILWGQHDRHLPPYWGLRLHQEMPQSYFQVLPECGHFVMIDNPLMLTEQLTQHLQRAAMAQSLAASQPLTAPQSLAAMQPLPRADGAVQLQ